jgi:hypothetical protein
MNIAKWHAELLKAGMLPKLSHVHDGFENGFDQGIPEHRLDFFQYKMKKI